MTPDGKITIGTPQFERDAKDPAPAVSPAGVEFEALLELPAKTLQALGMRPWGTLGESADGGDVPGEKVLYLFPWEWYPHIPANFTCVGIDGETFPFEPGVTDNDKRFGLLAYGILCGDTA